MHVFLTICFAIAAIWAARKFLEPPYRGIMQAAAAIVAVVVVLLWVFSVVPAHA